VTPPQLPEEASWEDFSADLRSTSSYLSGLHRTLLNTVSGPNRVRHVVQSYFRGARPELQLLGIPDEILRPLDSEMQSLLRLLPDERRIAPFVTSLRAATRLATELEMQRELAIGRRAAGGVSGYLTTGLESAIIRTLRAMIPSASLSYQQALEDLRDPRKVSFRGTAGELREALREVLDYLAPDSDVSSSPGFRLEPNMAKPTMKQKVRFILRARRVPSGSMEAPMDAVELVEARTASFARSTYTLGSVSAHVSSTREAVAGMKPYIDSLLAELLQLHGQTSDRQGESRRQE
jgi:hypothetical protein